jgi:protein TonB
MKSALKKAVESNFFISGILHLLVILVSGVSCLFASASTIDVPPPVRVQFIGAPQGSQTQESLPQDTEHKNREKKKTPEPVSRKNVRPEKKLNKISKTPEKNILSEKPAKKQIQTETRSEQVQTKENKPAEKTVTDSKSASDSSASPSGSAPSSAREENIQAGIAYEQALLALLSKVKRYPERARRRGVSGEGTILLKLNRDGSVKDVRVIDSTSSSILDRELVSMVHRASPLPPLPPDYRRTEFLIPVSFSFSG